MFNITMACKGCTAIARDKTVTSALYAAPTRVLADLAFGRSRDGVDVVKALLTSRTER